MSLNRTKSLETEILSLRQVSLHDADIIHTEILSKKERLYYLDWNYSVDIDESKAFIENILDNYQKGADTSRKPLREYFIFYFKRSGITESKLYAI